jgi:hypothetical protein
MPLLGIIVGASLISGGRRGWISGAPEATSDVPYHLINQ